MICGGRKCFEGITALWIIQVNSIVSWGSLKIHSHMKSDLVDSIAIFYLFIYHMCIALIIFQNTLLFFSTFSGSGHFSCFNQTFKNVFKISSLFRKNPGKVLWLNQCWDSTAGQMGTQADLVKALLNVQRKPVSLFSFYVVFDANEKNLFQWVQSRHWKKLLKRRWFTVTMTCQIYDTDIERERNVTPFGVDSGRLRVVMMDHRESFLPSSVSSRHAAIPLAEPGAHCGL